MKIETPKRLVPTRAKPSQRHGAVIPQAPKREIGSRHISESNRAHIFAHRYSAKYHRDRGCRHSTCILRSETTSFKMNPANNAMPVLDTGARSRSLKAGALIKQSPEQTKRKPHGERV
jgi:hypothetical protein